MNSRNTQFFMVFAVIMLIIELIFPYDHASWIEVTIAIGITSFLATGLKSWLEKIFGEKAKNTNSNN